MHTTRNRPRGKTIPATTAPAAPSNPVSGVILQRLNEQLDAGLTLARARFMTHSAISMARNQFGPYWGSRHFVLQKLSELYHQGWGAIVERAPAAEPYQGRRALYRRPTNADVLGWAAREVIPHVVRKLRDRGTCETWRLGLRRSDTPWHLETRADALESFAWLDCPKGHFWADPFLAQHGNQLYVFFEDYDYATQKGVIACAAIAPDGGVSPAETVFERSYHLSYPLVFPQAGEWFMVPEASANGAVDLYRARRFPFDWVRETTLLSIPGLDSTPFQANGAWWMLTTPALAQNHAAVTLLYTAPRLTGPWKRHPGGPVSTDVRNARSAGHVINDASPGDEPALVRVAQNCAGGYGRNLVFQSIDQLTATTYRESALTTREPANVANLVGLHTYNRVGSWEIIDGKFRLPTRRVT